MDKMLFLKETHYSPSGSQDSQKSYMRDELCNVYNLVCWLREIWIKPYPSLKKPGYATWSNLIEITILWCVSWFLIILCWGGWDDEEDTCTQMIRNLDNMGITYSGRIKTVPLIFHANFILHKILMLRLEHVQTTFQEQLRLKCHLRPNIMCYKRPNYPIGRFLNHPKCDTCIF